MNERMNEGERKEERDELIRRTVFISEEFDEESRERRADCWLTLLLMKHRKE